MNRGTPTKPTSFMTSRSSRTARRASSPATCGPSRPFSTTARTSFFYKPTLLTAARLGGVVSQPKGDTPMNRVKIISVLVLDQNAAIEFYTRKLGFKLLEDKPFGETRWVTISLPKDSDLTLA